MFFLTGLQSASDAVIVMDIDKRSETPLVQSCIYRPESTEHDKLWHGEGLSHSDVMQLSGVEESKGLSCLASDLRQALTQVDCAYLAWGTSNNFPPEVLNVMRDHNQNNPSKRIRGDVYAMAKARRLKTVEEQHYLRKSCRIASDAFVQTMKASRSLPASEAVLDATFEYHCRINGAERIGYPPVVAGGPRGCTIHYISNDNIIKDGEMVLMDAGCEYAHCLSDITRTWPVNGRFSGPQREIYQAVLKAQKLTIDALDGLFGGSFYDLQKLCCNSLVTSLKELDVISPAAPMDSAHKIVEKLFPTAVGHHLGLELHDVTVQGDLFEKDMCITIEPGLYFSNTFTDSRMDRYRGIAVRIEDDVLITNGEPEIFTKDCPKEIEELESLMQGQT
eukprot:m.252217 g.252217  ORF g.252217 m.252217 type:complete len:391 (+) comp26703_c0_seq35:39-1211(+)